MPLAIVRVVVLAASVSSVMWVGGRGAQASAPSSQGSPSAAVRGGPAGSDAGGAKKKARKPSSKRSSPKSKGSLDSKMTRNTSTHLARQKPAHAQAGSINEDVRLTPFPSHAGAARKALAQNRRDQLDDAEKAARSPNQPERWQTVLFHLRDLDARADSEGCFWRLVSYYRLGQIERARSLRQSCDLAPKDAGIIEAEDDQAARLRTAGALADKEAAPADNLAPYAGDGPSRVDR